MRGTCSRNIYRQVGAMGPGLPSPTPIIRLFMALNDSGYVSHLGCMESDNVGRGTLNSG